MPRLLDRLRWPGRTRRRKSVHWATGPFWLLDGAGAPRLPRDFASLAAEGYQSNPIAFRCVRLIADAAASVPFLLYDGRTEVSAHPLLERLARPNPYTDGTTFLEAAFSYLLLAGSVYIEAIGEGDPAALFLLRPDRVSPVLGDAGWPIAYRYRAGGRDRTIDQTNPAHPPVLPLLLFHPTDDHAGLSPIEAAAPALAVHNASAAWSRALLENAARPSGALVYKAEHGAALTDEQFERLKAELEASFSGAANAGRPMLLEGGLDWKALSLSPQDMDFLNAKHAAAREIALAFGVPPMLLGIPGDNTYSNYREASLALWRQTVMPLAERACRALSQWLCPRYGEASFLSEAEKREAAGYSPLPPVSPIG